MDDRTREGLRIRLSVALSLASKQVKRDLCEKVTAKTAPANAAIIEALLVEIEAHFGVTMNEDGPVRPSMQY